MSDDGDLKPGDEAAPDAPGADENVCPTCGGSGRVGDGPAERACPTCDGTGVIEGAIGGG